MILSPHAQRIFTIVMAACVVLATIVTIATLRARAATNHHLEDILTDLESAAYHLNALEWQAMAGQHLDEGLRAEVQAVDAQMQHTLEAFSHLAPQSQSSFDQAYETYHTSTTEEFQLLQAGKIAEARTVDEEAVDPSYDRLKETIEEQKEKYRTAAQYSSRIATIGSGLALLVAASLISLLFWRFGRVRDAHHLLLAEERMLRKVRECASGKRA